MTDHPKVVIVGAGFAGLAAASKLADAGVSVEILEARDRIGGRAFTLFDEAAGAPIELGAEFIHGFPPEIWQPLQQANVPIREVDGDNWCVNGRLSKCRFFDRVDKILEQMDAREPDESFLDFLKRRYPNPSGDAELEESKRRALDYVSGFNAADPALVGVHWLVEGMQADEVIEGERAFRAERGYSTLIDIFRQRLAKAGVSLRAETVVERIRWKAREAEIRIKGSRGIVTILAERALITLPLAVLKAPIGETGAVEFLPALPAKKLDAANRLEMGKVIRVVLTFRHRFWDSISPSHSDRDTLGEMSFLFTEDEWFPTWWTLMPEKLPMIMGWAPFQAAERLSGKDEAFVVDQSLRTLGGLLKIDSTKLKAELQSAHFHDWQSDPFSRGAYSYGKVGSEGAQQALAEPLENTLFFAGEATDITGHNGTVHGAIASGYRAAAEILRGIGK